ncbi:hypothetical protein PBY51_017494 [Eleginops maclovinus]|uniref:Integrase catalytic domain-containing protein n=1 Tax=Eleginops maclovinus TaxID=56733 RepID=A0AAN8AP11_ELEMC|nr:hypothetical protein PBY51_017494 [Eleginops maclovinus]
MESKSLQQLKKERTTAKQRFSRLANSLLKSCKKMSAEELVEAFSKVALEADRVMEANEEVEISWTEEEAQAKEDVSADIKKTSDECEEKLEEVEQAVQRVLWGSFGNPELSLALGAAERECERMQKKESGLKLEVYELMLSNLEGLVRAGKEAIRKWTRWVPDEERPDFQQRMRRVEGWLLDLISEKATLLQAKLENDGSPGKEPRRTPAIKLKPTVLPQFDGNKRNFYLWKKEWEALQKQGEPTGSREVRKFQLLDSLEEKVARDLRLSTYGTADEIFRVLENRFGNKTAIALEIVEELQALPPVKSYQPRQIVDLIQVVEKALYDLSALGNTGALKNPLVTKSLESKLPESLKKEWLVYVSKGKEDVSPEDRFDMLLGFLKSQEKIYEQLDQLRDDPSKREARIPQKHARTKSTNSSSSQASCVVCGDRGHGRKLYYCKKFKELRVAEKKEAVKELGACGRCLEVHGNDAECKTTFLCKSEGCKDTQGPRHHYYLCSKAGRERDGLRKLRPSPARGELKKYTETQEEFLTSLAPDLAQRCRNVFCNSVSKTFSSVMAENGIDEFPVIMMILEVTANAGQKLGTLIDLASDTNYITHEAAWELNLQSEDVTLIVHGVGGMQVTVETKRYLLKIRVTTSKGTLRSHQLVCYGLNSIAEVNRHVPPKRLQKIFPDVPLHKLVRPTKIKLLISQKEGQLIPQKVRSVGDLVLWDGPLGTTVGGSHPDLLEDVTITAHGSRTHFARSMRTAAAEYKEIICKGSLEQPPLTQATTCAASKDFLDWWRWDRIGAACEPRCGGCRCGHCQPGGKEMTISEERELEQIKSGLTYVTGDRHSEKPHWHAKYPWIEDPVTLPNNRRAVEATFMRTEKAITRVNIGDKPAGCIAQVAMRETANLPMFNHLADERRVLEQDAYVDDVLTSHNDPSQLKQITANVEKILEAGGFYMKPWVYSGQSGRPGHRDLERKEPSVMVLPNQLSEENNKALGLGYDPESDKLRMMVAVNFSKKKKKMRLGENLLQDEVRARVPNPLTRRELLSQVSGLYDPLGLVTPVKQKGAILVRRAFQEAKGKYSPSENTWDVPLSEGLREDAVCLFEDYAELGRVSFVRALTPPDPSAEPCGITFSDGSERSYGAVLYLRWKLPQDVTIRLVKSKARLTPLDHKGDAVKAEVCGAVYAARLKKYFQKHCRICVERWYHLVDSQTVLGAIQRESYGYQTFFANRIGEIQGSTNVQDWWWIPGPLNIADIISRGASPRELDEGTEWQLGPKFLSLPESEWPVKSAKDVAAEARENLTRIQKKAFVAALTRAGAKQEPKQESRQEPKQDPTSTSADLHRPPAEVAASSLLDIKRFSSLTRLMKSLALVWGAAKKFLHCRARGRPKWEAVPLVGIITAAEREDSFRDLCLAAQEGVTFPSTTTDRLVVYKDGASGLLLCGGRIQYFKEDCLAVPLVPFDTWLGTLLARQSHQEGHEGVAGTLLRMRQKAWVIQGRRLAQKVVNQCIHCRKARAQVCQQVMGDLPVERSRPAAPFQFISVDLFGPYLVRDDIKKRVSMKVWGVVFCCMASRALHIDLASSLSTESFLMAYQRFAAIRGHPLKVWSDPGTNFVGARSLLEDLYTFLQSQDTASLEEYAVKNGTSWTWKVLPADSPHRNGAAEAAVRIAKRALQSLGKTASLTFNEFLTALQLAANLANERPIDARIQSREDRIEYVTPNSLLLGRASPSGDVKSFSFNNYPYKRLREIQTQVNEFWKAWSQLAGPSLFIRTKWHTTERNVSVGDVVWLCDQNALRGHFRLGRVVTVAPDSKDIVRDVEILVTPSNCASVQHQRPATKSSERSEKSNGVVL